ncbi:MAG: hypothetical protein KGL39_07965 [Patescibacteria group bacterium]|nr:hypothetical protein [Patescibacteria group bacterium]
MPEFKIVLSNQGNQGSGQGQAGQSAQPPTPHESPAQKQAESRAAEKITGFVQGVFGRLTQAVGAAQHIVSPGAGGYLGKTVNLVAAGSRRLNQATGKLAHQAGRRVMKEAGKSAMSSLGKGAGSLARGVGAGAEAAGAGEAAGAAAGGMEAAGAVGAVGAAAAPLAVVGVVVAGLAAVGVAAYKLSEAFIARGKELQRFSPDIAGASAGADVRSMLADMREAQELGPAIARMIDAQSQAENDLREILLPIKKVVADQLAVFMEYLRDFVQWLRESWAGALVYYETLIDLVKDIANRDWDKLKNDVETLPERMASASAKERKKREMENNFDLLANFKKMDQFNDFLHGPNDPVAEDLRRRAAAPALEF